MTKLSTCQYLEKIVEDSDVFQLETIDHGVVIGYESGRPIETAKNRIVRVGNLSKYSFADSMEMLLSL